jgi:hypothetical protein
MLANPAGQQLKQVTGVAARLLQDTGIFFLLLLLNKN